MKKVLFVILCIVIFVIFWGIGSKVAMNKIENDKMGELKVKWDESVGTQIKDLSYGEKEINKFDLYLPSEKKESYALIVHIHGGGFTSGSKEDGEILSKYYASRGYVATSINYSLMEEGNNANLNLMYDELVKAVNEVIKVSNDKGYNITEMATTGESAGGCLAMLLAFRYGDESPVPIRFVIEESGPASFEPELWANTDDQIKINFINRMAGKSFELEDIGSEDYQNAINEISPVYYVNENTIPILLAYGPNDKIVPPKIKEPFLKALKDNNVPHDYLLFEHSGHGLLNDPDTLKEYHKKMNEYTERYFEN
jgi:acetyl esterase/lipase